MRTQSVAVAAHSVIVRAGRSCMMIVGRGVAVKGTGGRNQVRGHGAAAEAALRRDAEQPAP